MKSLNFRQFESFVGVKYQLYNSLFTSLPFHKIERTGILLSLLLNNCEDGYAAGKSPEAIIEEFFERHTNYTNPKDKIGLLFRFIQYAERQIVLFDALEDAAFSDIHDMDGEGSCKQLIVEAHKSGMLPELKKKLENYSVSLVLTAHPTQFYPDNVLGIIHDLAKALGENNTLLINSYLQQLGKTPFLKKKRPTPYDEAISLIWYLENVFYVACGKIFTAMKNNLGLDINFNYPFVRMGFWPGGDRDGNPFVLAETTVKVASALRGSIIKCYYTDVRKLKRRLTFEGTDVLLAGLEKKLYDNIFIPGYSTALTKTEILETLFEIRKIIEEKHNGLFIHMVDMLINKVQLFGLYFASLDIRQDSSVHTNVLTAIKNNTQPTEPIVQETIECMQAMSAIQNVNGQQGCHRYIISHCTCAQNVMDVYELFLLSGWHANSLTVDIVPLFETVEDLQHAATVMEELYMNSLYKQHLSFRGNKQVIMVGFSDGTKDGGYLMANWSIYKAKEALTALSNTHGIDVVFFDGRGGPPARGGGKTHQFYESMGANIANKEIQLTIQGQTISSNFGTIDAARFNIEQLLHAGIGNSLFAKAEKTLNKKDEALIDFLANKSYDAYSELRNHPQFLHYLVSVSPLKYYSDTNIASRPSKRGSSSSIEFSDLRAIPFVGALSQIKQNVTGFYGMGAALKSADERSLIGEIRELYASSLFFKTLINNCEMAMSKCYFPLTLSLKNHPQFGEIWNKIANEYELTKQYLLLITGKKELMEDFPVEQASIQMRERIVLPLTTIQQYALKATASPDCIDKEVYEKLIIRSSFGIINAARNSA